MTDAGLGFPLLNSAEKGLSTLIRVEKAQNPHELGGNTKKSSLISEDYFLIFALREVSKIGEGKIPTN